MMLSEQDIKRQLDGLLFYISVMPGPEATPVVKARHVPKDHIPDHTPRFEYVTEPNERHHNQVTFSAEQDDTIVNMRAEGRRWADVAKAISRCVNLTRDRYKVICAERNMKPAPNRRGKATKTPEEVKQQIFSLRLGGWEYERIAADFGMTKWQVADIVASIRKRMKGAA